MKKENKKWIVIGVLILLVVLSQGKKEAIELMFDDIDIINSDFIVWYSGIDKSQGIDSMSDDELIELLVEFHAIAKSPILFDSSYISQINNELTSGGFSYQLKSSYTCSEIKPQLDDILDYIKTEMASEVAGSEVEGIYNVAKTHLINNIIVTEKTENGKKVIELNLPSITNLNNFCQEAFLLLPYDDYTNIDFCDTQDEEYNQIREALYLLHPTVVCDGSYMFITLNEPKAIQFTSYTKSSNSFDGFRNFYMQDIGKVDGDWALLSTIELNACYVDSDCNENDNEECDNMKCVVEGTDDVGEGGIEENTETITDDKEWFAQPFIWIIFGVFMVMMVMMKQ